jgi:hypothetical protein
VIPAAEIIGFDFGLSRYNRRFSGSSDYDVSRRSIRNNRNSPTSTAIAAVFAAWQHLS